MPRQRVRGPTRARQAAELKADCLKWPGHLVARDLSAAAADLLVKAAEKTRPGLRARAALIIIGLSRPICRGRVTPRTFRGRTSRCLRGARARIPPRGEKIARPESPAKRRLPLPRVIAGSRFFRAAPPDRLSAFRERRRRRKSAGRVITRIQIGVGRSARARRRFFVIAARLPFVRRSLAARDR